MNRRSVFEGKRLKILEACYDNLKKSPKNMGEIHILRGAFGSGEHETTVMCLKLLEEYNLQGLNALDLGTGTGILAIAALRLGCAKVMAVDPSPEAIETCKRNARLNGVEDKITTILGTLDQVENSSRFDLIMANLYGHLLEEVVAPLCSMLNPRGIMVLSGMLYGEDFSIRREAERCGVLVDKRLGGEEYLGLSLTKRM